MVRLEAGDTFSVQTPGGGGYGPSLERDPEAVRADVVAGVVTPEAARRQYGVAIQRGGVDQAATLALRSELKATGPNPAVRSAAAAGAFDLGEAREAYETVFTPGVSDALMDVLFTLPPGLRYYAKGKMFARIRGLAGTGKAVTPEHVRAIWPEVLEGMGLRQPTVR